MKTETVGHICALGSAVSWSCAVVLFKSSSDRISPIALNLFKNVVALVLFITTIILLRSGFDDFHITNDSDIVVLVFSGVIGIGLADTLFFYALRYIGVGLISIVECTYSPMVLLCSWLMLGERLGPAHYLGGALILGGVLTASRIRPPPDRTRQQLVVGMLLGVAGIAAMGVAIVWAKPIIVQWPLLWSTTLRLAAGTAALALVAMFLPVRRELGAVFRPSRTWRLTLPASILGTYCALLLWIGGFKYAKATVAAMLNQTSTIFAIILATIVLKETFTSRKLLAVALAFSGVVVTLVGPGLLETASGGSGAVSQSP